MLSAPASARGQGPAAACVVGVRPDGTAPSQACPSRVCMPVCRALPEVCEDEREVAGSVPRIQRDIHTQRVRSTDNAGSLAMRTHSQRSCAAGRLRALVAARRSLSLAVAMAACCVLARTKHDFAVARDERCGVLSRRTRTHTARLDPPIGYIRLRLLDAGRLLAQLVLDALLEVVLAVAAHLVANGAVGAPAVGTVVRPAAVAPLRSTVSILVNRRGRGRRWRGRRRRIGADGILRKRRSHEVSSEAARVLRPRVRLLASAPGFSPCARARR